jgi:acyl-coenzyme A synthetase/AMP-(fatty) acid ligase/acyl carrier protein
VIVVENVLQVGQVEGVKLINTVPSAMMELLRMKAIPETVRTVNLAGEALKRALPEQIYKESGVERVVNLYGPTEDTTYTSYEEIERGGKEEVGIGRAISNSRIYVLDEGMKAQPVGVAGELYIGGAGVGRGYLGRPEMTAEKFVPDGLSGERGGRLYRTGDRGRWREEGWIEFLGRLDEQVKLRGYRIELGEIEATLEEYEGVKQAAVMVREEETSPRLVGYVVGNAGQELVGEQLQEHLRKRLPEYMVPGAMVILDSMPTTSNGKLDRKRLPAPNRERPKLKQNYVAPQNAVEELVTAIWAEVLQVERVGVNDNFFALGGHSLLAMQVMSRLRDAFNIDLSVRQLFNHATAGQLADAIAAVDNRKGRMEKIAQILLQVWKMSMAEVNARLRKPQ